MQAVLLTDAYLDRCLGAVPEALHSDSRLQLPFHGHCPVPDGELVRRALAAMGRRPS
jgi:hypothetical protein